MNICLCCCRIQEAFDIGAKHFGLKKKINEYKYEGKDDREAFKRKFYNDVDYIGKAITDAFTEKD